MLDDFLLADGFRAAVRAAGFLLARGGGDLRWLFWVLLAGDGDAVWSVVFFEDEVDGAILHTHGVEDDGDFLPELEAAAAVLADEAEAVGVVVVVVVDEGGDVDEAFDGVFQPHEKAEGGDADDLRLVFCADEGQHVFGDLEIDAGALCFLGVALAAGGLLAGVDEALVIMLDAVLVEPAAGLQIFLDEPVDGKVAVAADRRGEMGVVATGEAKMAGLLGGVVGVVHGAQHHHADDLGAAFLLCLGKDPLHVPGGKFPLWPAGEHDAEALDVLQKGVALFWLWLLVDAIDKRHAAAEEIGGDGFVGEDHEFFDDLLGLAALAHDDVDGMTGVVEDDLALWQIKLEGAAFYAIVVEGFREGAHVVEGVHVRWIFGEFLRLQDLVDGVVGEAALDIDDGFADLCCHNLAPRVDLHHAGKGEAVLPGVQAADAVADRLWQHRQHAVDKIHTGAALVGLLVEDGAFADVFANIGDVHAEHDVAVFQRHDLHSVVKVLGIGAVDGHNMAVEAEIAAALQLAFHRLSRQSIGLAQRLWRKARRQIVAIDQREHIDPRRIRRTEATGDLPFRDLALAAPVGDLNKHLVAVGGAKVLSKGTMMSWPKV